MCPICKEEFSLHDKIITVLFTQNDFFDPIEPKPWISTQVHSKCSPKSKASENVYGKYDPSMFCHYCGLPLTPKILPAHPITHKLLEDHFFGFELNSIRLLENLMESWFVHFNFPSLFKDKRAIEPNNSTIRTVYANLNQEIPEWLDNRIQNDENNSEIEPYGEVCHEISKDLMFTFDRDLSNLGITEKFLHFLSKYRKSSPKDYNISSRIIEIWSAAQSLKKSYDESIRKSYMKLLGPEANLYSHIDLAFDFKDYDFDKAPLFYRHHVDNHVDKSSYFAQTFTVKCGNRYYHPYCAAKLGLNDNHCNDNNSKGGEGVE